MRIKILGSGCAKCNRLEQLAREAVAELGVDAEFEHVRDMEAIMAYPIMTTPALVVAIDDVADSLALIDLVRESFPNLAIVARARTEFVQKISGGGIGIFFFAGHGLQVNNQNFLVPVDMDSPRNENDLDL